MKARDIQTKKLLKKQFWMMTHFDLVGFDRPLFFHLKFGSNFLAVLFFLNNAEPMLSTFLSTKLNAEYSRPPPSISKYNF
jgi:hypothetical protein